MKERLVSLDVFRGATIAAMILVNNAGDWDHVYRQLEHAPWDGCTLTDLIFPFFIFIMGVAIPLAFAKRTGSVAWPIARRTLLLLGLGLLLNAFPFNSADPTRLPGVLQRIALCYLVAAPLSLRVSSRGLAVIAVALLAGYCAALALGGDLTPEGNLGARIDRLVLGPARLYHARDVHEGRWDPEGLLSTLPAIATALSGVLAGRWITDSSRAGYERTSGLLVAGLTSVAAGLAISEWFPINKNLWSASYVLFTSGLACQTLGACYWLVDLHELRAWTDPFLAFGRNAIFVYMASGLVARLLVFGIHVHVGEKDLAAKTWLYRSLFAESTCFTSALYAFLYASAWCGVVALMDRKKIYVKV
jgi:predicted acyltransferase